MNQKKWGLPTLLLLCVSLLWGCDRSHIPEKVPAEETTAGTIETTAEAAEATTVTMESTAGAVETTGDARQEPADTEAAEDESTAAPDEIAQLCQAVLSYYEEQTGEKYPGKALIHEVSPEGVRIQLCEDMGDHLATAGWYLIDPESFMGVDEIMGTEIDFSPYVR